MRSRTPRDLAGHCPQCLMAEAICICSSVPRIATRTEIVIVRHVTESYLTSNTGRLVALALPNARIIEYGGGGVWDDTGLFAPDTALLYRAGRASQKVETPARLVVLDGTFRQARRMYTRIPALRHLPELALPAPSSTPKRLREPPLPDGMSTVEAVAAALALLEGPEIAEPLMLLYAEFVRRSDHWRGRQRPVVPGPWRSTRTRF
jgi:DTW domain-containing protein